jgi:hypothetical protein
MYKDFLKAFGDQLTIKSINENREYTAVGSIDSDPEEIQDLEPIEEKKLEVFNEKGVIKIIKAIFGFLYRFRKRYNMKNTSLISDNQNALNYVKSGNESNISASPSGEMQYSKNISLPNKLIKLFQDLAAHFINKDQNKDSNETYNLEQMNKNRLKTQRSVLKSDSNIMNIKILIQLKFLIY